MSLSQTTPLLPVDVLRDHLARGTTGCLSSGGTPVLRLYVMQGEVMAALSEGDGAALVRRMVNHGAITPRQGVAFARSVEQGRSAEELLLGHVPDRLFHELLRARFEENLAALCAQDGSVTVQTMDAIFVRNVQYGHDSRVLVAALLERLMRTAPLRLRAQPLTLRPGPSMPSNRDEQRVAELADPSMALADLLGHSPHEPIRTLDLVDSMLRAGALVSDEAVGLAPAPAPAPQRQRPAPGDFGVEQLFRLDDEPAPAVELTLEEEDGADGATLSDDSRAMGADALEPLGGAELEPLDDPPAGESSEGLMESTWSAQGGETVSLLPDSGVVFSDDDDGGDWADYSWDVEPDELPAEAPPAPPPEAPAAPPPESERPTRPIERTEIPQPLPVEPSETHEVAAPGSADDTWNPEAQTGAADPDTDDEADAAVTAVTARPGAVEAAVGPDDDALFGGGSPQGPDDDALFGGGSPQGPDDDALFGGGSPQGPDDTAPGADDAFFNFDAEPDDLAMFEDQDVVRGGGAGQFSLKRDLLDVVDLREETIRRERTELPAPVSLPKHEDDDEDLILEAMGAEDAELTEDDKVVALSFGAPPLSHDEMEHKLDVCNSVLQELSAALDGARGRGSGATSVQLLLDGAPSSFAIIFHGLMVRKDGTFDIASAAANLARRPEGEWRALADRGIMDLIERALSMAVEELGDDEIDQLLRRIAGYQQRLRY